MKRRTLLIGAGMAALGATGYAASETGVLSGELSGTSGTVTAPGEFTYNTAGLELVRWVAASDGQANLEIHFTDTPPDAFRLHRPDGRKVWASRDIETLVMARQFGLPLNHHGTWKLVVENGGTYTSLEVPVRPRLDITTFALRGETLVAEITNPTDAPHWIEKIRVSPDAVGYGEYYEPNNRLMPGESYTLETPYPFKYYSDIEISVWAGDDKGGTYETKSFV